jgi:hypothetical protein
MRIFGPRNRKQQASRKLNNGEFHKYFSVNTEMLLKEEGLNGNMRYIRRK